MSSGGPPTRALPVLGLPTSALGFGTIRLCGSDDTLISKPALLQDQGALGMLPAFAVPGLIAGIVMVKVCGARSWHSMPQFRLEDALS